MRDAVEKEEPIIVERGGKPHVVVISIDAYERLMATQEDQEVGGNSRATPGSKCGPTWAIGSWRRRQKCCDRRESSAMNNSPVCVDASLVIRLVVDPGDELVRSKWERWDSENWHIAAPTGLLHEDSNALSRYQRTGMMSRAAARLALKATLSLPLQLYRDTELHTRALDLAEHLSLPAAYDAHYIALADWLGAEFWTADQRLAGTVQDALPWVRVVEARS